jgi:hypothetical protein
MNGKSSGLGFRRSIFTKSYAHLRTGGGGALELLLLRLRLLLVPAAHLEHLHDLLDKVVDEVAADVDTADQQHRRGQAPTRLLIIILFRGMHWISGRIPDT